MTQTLFGATSPAPTPDDSGRPAPGRRAHHWRPGHRLSPPIALQILAMIGIGALVYSPAADWFARTAQGAELSGYATRVDHLPSAAMEAALQVARDYNAHLPIGALHDPYTTAGSAGREDAGYQDALSIGGSGVMGQLTYGALGINLPIYHGTGDRALRQGAGHLYGSSLPIGGPSTHSVLTSHSGLLHASLFSSLPKARLGDTFQVTVLGQTHWYRVDEIETVLPEQTERLAVIPGSDLVTLITCTPVGVNSHRLLVRGVRVEGPEATDPLVAGFGTGAGFPWWALWFTAGTALVALVLFAPGRSRTERPRHG